MYTFGCDPEFIMVSSSNGTVYPGGIVSFDGRFGCDGDAFEIRPGYSTSVLNIVTSIYRILKDVHSSIKGLRKYEWKAGHCPDGYAPIGGHIHIGGLHIPRFKDQDSPLSWYEDGIEVEDDPDARDLKKAKSMIPVVRFVSIIDIGSYYGLSNLIDDKRARTERQCTGYGRPTVFRTDSQQGCYISHVEYRTPGSFLISPRVALLNLGIVKVITRKYFKDNKVGEALLGLKSKGSKRILSAIKELMEGSREEDMVICCDLLRDLLKKKWKIRWNDDFKKNWGLKDA